jgi:hypothetical protein
VDLGNVSNAAKAVSIVFFPSLTLGDSRVSSEEVISEFIFGLPKSINFCLLI